VNERPGGGERKDGMRGDGTDADERWGGRGGKGGARKATRRKR